MKKSIIFIAVFLMLLVCATAGGMLLIMKNPQGMFDTYPEIVPPGTETGTQSVALAFPFENDVVKGTVDLKLAPYLGAQNAEKSAHLYGESKKNTGWMNKYYLAITNDPQLEDVYSKLTGFFKTYAAAHSLTDDEYIELVTAYVQSIPYSTSGLCTKFPVETVIDGLGDCDDKSTLLAGLLSYAGFDTALLSFDNHMACAVKTDGGFYVPIETTAVMYIGDTSGSNAAEGIDLTKPLDTYKIGGGTKVYKSYGEVQQILKASDKLMAEWNELEGKMKKLNDEIGRQEIVLKAGDFSQYSSYVKNVDTYNEYVVKYNEAAGLLKRIYNEAYNRKGVYEAVKNI